MQSPEPLSGHATPLLPPSPFTAVDAAALGISRGQLRRMVTAKLVRRVLREVYADCAVPDTTELRADAVGLVVSRNAVVTDRSAAWLWGIDVLQASELDTIPRLELYVLRGHTRVRRPEAGGGSRDLSPRDICEIRGVKVTTPLRTSLDLGCRLTRYDALAAMDAFARTHGIVAAVLVRELPRFAGRRGVVQLRELVALVDGRAESSGESFTRLAIHDAGLPAPTPQHWVIVAGVRLYRLDLAYPWLKICIEYDGEEFHSDEEKRKADRRRRRWLREQGWLVIVVDRHSFGAAARDAWLHELRVAMADRTRSNLRG